VSAGELVQLNLTSPAVLAFVLGALATTLRSDLRFPESITSFLSSYLLLAIGLKGGVAIADSSPADLWLPALATIALGTVTPLVGFVVARRFVRLDVGGAASLAAHYGSVSAVTFTAAVAFATAAGTPPEGFLPALVALLEVPGIVVALALAGRHSSGSSFSRAVHEVFTGKSVVLLVGGVVIGLVADQSGWEKVEPLFVDLFPGILVLFLLDLGVLAGRRVRAIAAVGPRLVVFAVAVPLMFGALGVLAASLVGLSTGGATVLGAMAASASYIAAPAAVRTGLPHTDPAIALGAALGVTFPFNLAIGIPLYAELAALVT
jgi:uncharacterized protein